MLHQSTQFAMDTANHAETTAKLIKAAIEVIKSHPKTGLDLLGQAADITGHLHETALVQFNTALMVPHTKRLEKDDDDGDALPKLLEDMRRVAEDTDLDVEVYG